MLVLVLASLLLQVNDLSGARPRERASHLRQVADWYDRGDAEAPDSWLDAASEDLILREVTSLPCYCQPFCPHYNGNRRAECSKWGDGMNYCLHCQALCDRDAYLQSPVKRVLQNPEQRDRSPLAVTNND